MSLTFGLWRSVLCLMFLAWAGSASAAIYMKYGTIKGDVTAENYKDWIEIHSIELGVARSIAAPTGGSADREAATPNISEIAVTKLHDLASAYLFAESLFGEGQQVQIHLVSTDDGKLSPYLKMTLEDTMVSGYSQSSGGDRPSESLSLNFTKITLDYISTSSTGQTITKTVIYDIARATGSGP